MDTMAHILRGVGVTILLLWSTVWVWSGPAVTVLVDGQVELSPVPRGLWEGQHLAFSARLLKRHERELLHYIPLRQARTHDSDISLDLVSLGPGAYDFTPIDQFIEDLKGLGLSEPGPGLMMNLEFTPRWLWREDNACPGRSPRYYPPRDWDAWAQVVEDTVGRIRQRAPAIERYYEVWNEPNMVGGFWMPCEPDRALARQEYLRLYRETALAVRRADPDGKIGGPSIALVDDGATAEFWIPSFLDFCRANGLPVHFVSFHRYEQRMLSRDTRDGASVRDWLRQRSLDDVEIINTEWNLTTEWGFPSAQSEAMFGAVIPARVLSFYKGTVDRSVYFAAPEAPGALILPNEQVRPAYNVFRMLDVLQGVTVSATSDGLDADGVGVGVLAALDRTRNTLAVLTWNYHYDNLSAPSTAVNLDVRQLPEGLRDQSLIYRRYLVDAATSNWIYNPEQDHLQGVEERALGPSADYRASLSLQPNAVTLLVFCRQDGPCPNLSSPARDLGPIIRSLFVDFITETAARVTWITDRPSTSKVEYGPSMRYESETDTDTVPAIQHTMELRNLTRKTKYYFRAVSADERGRQTKSEDWWSFRTPDRGLITRVFKPTDNTFVNDTSCITDPDAFYADSSVLSVRDTVERAYLRFDLRPIARDGHVNARAAELRLLAADYGDGPGRLYLTKETTWQDTDVTCRWQPTLISPPLDTPSGPVANGFTYSFAATEAVQRGAIFSFGLDQPLRWSKAAYASTRHYGLPPLLFVTIDAPRGNQGKEDGKWKKGKREKG